MEKKSKQKYKSKFESNTASYLKKNRIKYKYEPFSIPYSLEFNYTPDWELENGIIIETKGKLDVFTRRKMLAVKEQNPEYDIRFVFQLDNRLYRGSKSRYSDWCRKHGFPYAIGTIPDEWLRESVGSRPPSWRDSL